MAHRRAVQFTDVLLRDHPEQYKLAGPILNSLNDAHDWLGRTDNRVNYMLGLSGEPAAKFVRSIDQRMTAKAFGGLSGVKRYCNRLDNQIRRQLETAAMRIAAEGGRWQDPAILAPEVIPDVETTQAGAEEGTLPIPGSGDVSDGGRAQAFTGDGLAPHTNGTPGATPPSAVQAGMIRPPPPRPGPFPQPVIGPPVRVGPFPQPVIGPPIVFPPIIEPAPPGGNHFMVCQGCDDNGLTKCSIVPVDIRCSSLVCPPGTFGVFCTPDLAKAQQIAALCSNYPCGEPTPVPVEPPTGEVPLPEPAPAVCCPPHIPVGFACSEPPKWHDLHLAGVATACGAACEEKPTMQLQVTPEELQDRCQPPEMAEPPEAGEDEDIPPFEVDSDALCEV